MKQIDYKLLEESFFNMYQSIINYFRLTRTENSTYTISISRTLLEDNITSVTIKIENNNNPEQKFIFNDKLTNEKATNLINNVRVDFRENHYISYSSVNQREYMQTLQNTNFTLKIELKSDEEVEDAINFNTKINTNGERHKVLTRA